MRKSRKIAVKGGIKKQANKISLPLLVFALVAAFTCFGFLSFFVKEAYDETKLTFLERLTEEKRVAEINANLKMELLAITQKGYVEFVAGERLGLKKPKEEEVLVLR